VGIGAAALLAWLLPMGLLAPSAEADGAATERVLRPNAVATTRLAQANPCGARNPCAGTNPCAGRNPCGGTNPCAGANPCGGGQVDASRFEQPAGVPLASGDRHELIAEGKKLWNDPKLGKSGLSCANCHVQDYAMMNPTFAKPYPHYVEMAAQQGGVEKVSAAEMVNFCMIVPMASEPLPWTSQQLAALTAYVESIQPGFEPVAGGGANPCGARNPCGGK
jgi:hypothetical protein